MPVSPDLVLRASCMYVMTKINKMSAALKKKNNKKVHGMKQKQTQPDTTPHYWCPCHSDLVLTAGSCTILLVCFAVVALLPECRAFQGNLAVACRGFDIRCPEYDSHHRGTHCHPGRACVSSTAACCCWHCCLAAYLPPAL